VPAAVSGIVARVVAVPPIRHATIQPSRRGAGPAALRDRRSTAAAATGAGRDGG
jgi:hypothetical protein